jgi:hypothetical protein
MYTQIWNKYLPIIKILLKRSVASDQLLNLNITDFERAGVARKSGYKFNIHFVNGRVDNIINTSPLAKDLAAVMLQDPTVVELMKHNDYHLNMTAKFVIGIKHIAKASEQPDTNVNDTAEVEAAAR